MSETCPLPEVHNGRIVDPSEWGSPVPRCDTCFTEHQEYGRIEGDGFLPDGSPCPDCYRGKENATAAEDRPDYDASN